MQHPSRITAPLTPDRAQPRRVAIIGGGVAGSLAAITLAGLPGIGAITVIDRDAAFGRGLAYSAPAPWHRINVPAYKMGGVGSEDGEGFADWLKATGQADWPDYSASFVPRRVYGDYIAARLQAVIDSGMAATRADSVTGIDRCGDGYRLILAAGNPIVADLVFLCLGNPSPSPFAGIEPSPRSITDVWAPGALDGITVHDRVLVIGTGATAVDVVIELVQRGIKAPMTMISRRGLLPLIDAPALADPAPLQTWPEPTARGVLAALLADSRAKIAAGIPWQTMVDTFRLQIGELWADAPEAERTRFARHLRAIWLVHRHRLAPDVAALLAALQQDGRLDVLAGRIIGATTTPAGYRVTIRKRGGATMLNDANWILNCTGPEERYDRIDNPLVASLLSTGMAGIGQNGLGLDVDQNYHVRNRGGQSEPGLYAVGHATRGAFWEVTAAANIRGQLLEIADTLRRAHAGAVPS